ncbi:MarR family winged helix-turn-helix transcriptional regulator [Kineococcus sp. NUM-3379]
MPEDEDALLNAVGAAFSRLRRRTVQVAVEPPVSRKDLSRNLVINIIDESDSEVSVGELADQLGVDPSVASRAVADCISEGYLVRAPSQHDGRRSVLHITPGGFALRDRFRSQQRQAFEHITRDWPDQERLQFARLLIKYADAAAQLPR